MSKLFNLKEWLTVADAARHLSIVFGEDVTEADVLHLALDGHLTLSVNFVNGTFATRGVVVPISKAKVVPGRCIDGEEPYMVMFGYSLKDDEIVQFDDNPRCIRGVWDLCMLESEKFDVEELFYRKIGGPPVDRWSLEGTMVTRGDGYIYRLEQEMEKPTKESFDKQSEMILNGLMSRIARDLIGKDEAKRLIDEHHERRKSIWEDKSPDYFPASALPADSVIVVRTAALREFERHSNDAPLLTPHAHVSDKLAKMNQASTKFWCNADRDDRGTHPENARVAAWLVQQGFSPTLADKAATIIRPEWAPSGRKPEE